MTNILDNSSSIQNYLTPAQEMKIASCVSEELLPIEHYKVEIIKGIDGNYWPDIDTMTVYPIEMGFYVEFNNSDKKGQQQQHQSGYGFRQTEILDIQIKTQMKDGFFRKKEDALLELVLNHNSERREILINVEDKHISKILESINYNRKFDYNEYLKTLEIQYESGGLIENTTVYPNTPFIAVGENILWSNVQTKGTLNRRVVWLEALTNFRIFQYNYESHLASYAFFSAIDDVIVTNQKRISESQSGGTYYGNRFGSMRTGYGNTKTRSTSVTYVDVVFITDGKPFITLFQIRDPHGLSRIAKGVKKQTTQVEKLLKKGTRNKVKNNNKESDLTCQSCGTTNDMVANFCNQCGTRLK